MAGDKPNPMDYASAGQDVVEQMITGLGWRVTAEFDGPSTTSVLVTGPDATGAKFVITARKEGVVAEKEEFEHFNKAHLDRFYGAHAERPGIAVMCFESHKVGAIEEIYGKYKVGTVFSHTHIS